MGQIKINNIIYGTTSAAEILYNDITVKEKLDTIPVFDINDNGNVSPSSDYLTYGHIIDNLNSSATDKVLSANQGRILKESIENIDFSPLEAAINENDIAIESLNTNVSNNSTEINNIKNSYIKNNSEGVLWGLHIGNERNQGPYIYSENNNINFRWKDSSNNYQYSNIDILSKKMGFIDTSRLLARITTKGSSYTATEPCFAMGWIQGSSNTGGCMSLDGEIIIWSQVNQYGQVWLPLDTGQTIFFRNESGNPDVRIYALK